MPESAGAELARLRWQKAEYREVVCQWCGEGFRAKSAKARYCRPGCRQKAYQARRRNRDGNDAGT